MSTPESIALHEHLNTSAGTCCHAPADRYCATGCELWLEDKAAHVAGLNPDREAMIAVMQDIHRNVPAFAYEIGQRAKARIRAGRVEA